MNKLSSRQELLTAASNRFGMIKINLFENSRINSLEFNSSFDMFQDHIKSSPHFKLNAIQLFVLYKFKK